MGKLDLKKELKALYAPSAKAPVVVEVPPLLFIMIDGEGSPEAGQGFQEVMSALYGLAYGVKFASKATGQDFVVMPLEALWWADDMNTFLTSSDQGAWKWTAMIAVPDWVTPAMFEAARASAIRKRGSTPALEAARLETYAEGTCVQIMYIGAYQDEGPTIQRLHAFAHEQGFELRGRHHEIYMGDPRNTDPSKLRTVIRQPVQ